MKKRTVFALCLLLAATLPSTAQNTSANLKSQTTWAHNPAIPSDVPDINVIRVGSDYYMVSTTMHLMPGVPIMHSRDLVHWELISYVVPEIKDSPAYDLQGGNVYACGQWATSLRYHGGKFYVLFATNRPQKTYIYATDNPAGKWQKVMDLNELHHDTSLFFDDDGKAYLAGGSSRVRIQQLKADLSGLQPGGLDVEVVNGAQRGLNGLLEGSHLCKYNNKYYLFMIWWPQPGIRTEVAFRCDKIDGPYEQKVILSSELDRKGAGVAQGCIVDTPSGDWYGYLFQDRGAVGRVPVIVPCRWIDGWPILGDEAGKAPMQMQVNLPPHPTTPLVTSDDFQASTLALQWQWNHNPDNASWSLTERKGYMRLHTVGIVKNIFEARNTLSQRTECPACKGTVALDVSHMKDGDKAGISAFCAEPGILSVEMTEGKKYVVMTDRDTEKARIPLTQNSVYLRMTCDFHLGMDIATFSYSTDNKNWKTIGTPFQMVYNLKHFMGNRFALFNYATRQAGGYVDIDFFHYERLE